MITAKAAGSYPGQPWLWLLWYHMHPFSSSASVDVWAICLTGLAAVLLLAVPFIPCLRDIPRLIPVHRLIWRPGSLTAAESTGGAEVPATVGQPE